MDEVKIDRKLKGKTNFVSWKREFERAAKNHDILEYLTGEEIVPPKPRKEDYFEKLIENDTRRLTRSMSRGMATTQSATPPTDEGEDAYDAQAMVPANNALQWQIDYKEHKVAKSQMKLAGRLLDAWVSDGIKIEIEDYPDAKDAYDFIKKRYAVTNERARDGLLSQLNSLKLAGCSCMTEYTNRIRQIKADLKTVKYDMTDDMLAKTFASVVKASSTRILLALAAILSWRVHQGDVKTAFLNSDLEKPVYIRPPKDIKIPHGFCLMVIRALYGLKQSPRAWYNKLRSTLVHWGWRMSAYDPCVFIHDNNGLILEVHVDDINVMGKDLQPILDFKNQISRTFSMTDDGECSWYLGMHVEQRPGEIRLHQKKYIDEIVARYGFGDAAPATTPLEKDVKMSISNEHTAHPKFRQQYQSKVGSLNFASNQTRPDISFATGYVARYASNPNQQHMKAVDRIFTYLRKDPGKGIVYSSKHGLQLRGFVDSDFAGCEDSRRSTTGWVFTLAGGPVSWSSQRQKTVATSTMDAEYNAAAEAAKEAVWIRNFINDLRIPGVHIDTVPLYIDNNSALKLTRNPEFHNRSKHIDVKHHFVREKVEEGVINTQRVNTRDNLADIFTKSLPKPTHEDVMERLNLSSGGVPKKLDGSTADDVTTAAEENG
ncbi:Retrovirus-related Pol polyprotein from transposon TNT 1-94 [Beauveria bassiana D1-5]|uniref:Retrovirus-related Pol polyprotein from transposon TNT 1-94 n=1 Tax=Beauveria bassiana D1-5 TaxID=1245745 RepID=A0A0A2VN40_BEABA|nr:Retrovirus-related Pol polyprotein from transposon TNT 1-94 [Beauveria bassiana D1-5]